MRVASAAEARTRTVSKMRLYISTSGNTLPDAAA
jgi:hypothetical protein